MARFEMQLPTEIMKDFQTIYNDAENIFGEMCKSGADTVESAIRANVPASFHGSGIMQCLGKTRVYKTPTDDGINCKVAFYGYFVNKNGVRVPAPLVCNVFEYGRSNFPKQPFLRRSFNKGRIEQAMLEAQKRASGGLLDE